jgi:chromosome segregation ATPase
VLSSSSSNTAALERITLQVDGLKSSLTESQEKNSELQRTNSDLLRQLEKWRNMESRDSGELEMLRSRKIELEVQVKELQDLRAEADQVQRERDKLAMKIVRYKDSLKEHHVSYVNRIF